MNTNQRIYPLVAACLLLLAACNQEEATSNGSGYFPADGVIRVAATTTDAPATRAGMTTNDLTNFQLNVKGATAAYNYYVSMHKLDLQGNSTTDWHSYDPTPPGNIPIAMLWQSKHTPIYVTAIAKKDRTYLENNFIDGSREVLEVNQTAMAIRETDLLYMPRTEIDPTKDLTTDGKIKVTLAHRLSKVKLVLTLGTEFNPAAANPVKELAINNTVTEFFFYHSTNILTLLDAIEPVKPFENTADFIAGSDATNAVANYEAILVPQTVAAGSFSVTFMLGDKKYSWTSANDVTLAPGMQHTLKLNVVRDIVTLGSITTEEWKDGDPMPDLETE